ncbi:ceramide glucosyltransferase [Grosmannia clavigera kw1407]|uniref:Ceramide glucosyltransferase n=1 Tax=Grosmannia clavigera (strain kw1407 / UAMH 11150) TaxID=655863 RepID=F0XL14_GROCL|nr:ceramide glucosyltransferase [Grosmannia clavigera kw1407]EFX01766.1 ceramide glucosyltransferase [Grosmannia clavigera kw1407]
MSDVVTVGFACVFGIWSCVVLVVQSIGIFQIFRQYSRPPRRAAVEALPDEAVPHVTVIRPVKGLEPALYECIASTFRQSYPRSRLSVHLCVEDRDDAALAVLEQVVADFPGVDARIYVEAEDPLLHGADGHHNNLGPNPKIRNISRAYREARGDIVWIVDCNVWVAEGVAGRMVDKLCGIGENGTQAKPYKFVHQLPLVIDITRGGEDEQLQESSATVASRISRLLAGGGGRLDEMFMATTHAKFYCAINTVGVAPCILGKSNMFRRSHLDRLTDPACNPTVLSAADNDRGRGIDFFSSYICEDHLIGDLLWRSPLPGFRNHGLAAGDLALQPMADTSVRAYAARRVRWLRVRKWTVLLATLVEPGVESMLCCFYAAFAITTLVPRAPAASLLGRLAALLAIRPVWTVTLRGWLVGVAVWLVADWFTSNHLLACRPVDVDLATTPRFARGRGSTALRRNGRPRRPFVVWLAAWLGRELLALPIWTWAVLLGTTVSWRGKQFRVRLDMSVVEIDGNGKAISSSDPEPVRDSVATRTSKARLD